MQNCAKLSEDSRIPWSKGKLIGQEPPLKLAEIRTVRTQLRMVGNTRELALFNDQAHPTKTASRLLVGWSASLGPDNFNAIFWIRNIRPIFLYPQDKIIHCLTELDFKFYNII